MFLLEQDSEQRYVRFRVTVQLTVVAAVKWCVMMWRKQRDVGTLHLTASLPEEGGLWARAVAPSAADQYLLPQWAAGVDVQDGAHPTRCYCSGWWMVLNSA